MIDNLNILITNIYSTLTSYYIYNDIVYKQNKIDYFIKKSDVIEYMKDYILKINKVDKNTLDMKSKNELYESLIDKYNRNIEDANILLYKINNIDDITKKEILYPKLYIMIKNMIEKEYLFSWIEYIGYFCIEYISLVINQQEVDRQTGSWLYIYNCLYNKSDYKRGNDRMVGNIKEMMASNNSLMPILHIADPCKTGQALAFATRAIIVFQ